MLEAIAEVLLTEEEIRAKVAELGRQISGDYAGKPLFLVCVLKGGFVFLADLMRAIDIPLEIGFVAVSSYGKGTRSSGEVRLVMDLDSDIGNKHVLVVEDIVDSGRTLGYIKEALLSRGPASVRICCLLKKARAQKSAVPLDYLGFEIPDRFVVGYGLDYAEGYRNLPFVGVLRPEKLG